jgi:signal transduction histidine kinase
MSSTAAIMAPAGPITYFNGVRTLGIRPIDAAIVAVVIVAVELNVAAGNGADAASLNGVAYLLGAILPLPILFRRRWPYQVLLACTALTIIFYIVHRRNISPAPALVVPVYDATVAGYLLAAIAVPAFFLIVGWLVVELTLTESVVNEATDFLPQFAVLAMAVLLGEVIRNRRALLRLTAEERAAEAARQVAEERLRIARELHDTVAHSMATITVQAGTALHLLHGDGTGLAATPAGIATVLTGIRDTSKSALAEMRTVLGQLRSGSGSGSGSGPDPGTGAVAGTGAGTGAVSDAGTGTGTGPGLERLAALRDAVGAAGVPVTVSVTGTSVALPPAVDHAAYRILQESLTNVLRHAGPDAKATVCLRYEPGCLSLAVSDDGSADRPPRGGHGINEGHGITGMRERAAAVGGTLTAAPTDGGGFQVSATLPTGDPA